MAPERSSSVAIARDGARRVAYVADADERAIHIVDVSAQRWLGAAIFEGRPTQVVALPDGRVATVLSDRHRLVMLEPDGDGLRTLCDAPTDAEPRALAAAPNGGLVVAAGIGSSVARYDLATLARRWRREVIAEPRALLVDDQGIWVSHATAGTLTRLGPDGAPADAADTRLARRDEDGERVMEEGQPAWRAANQGFALASVRLDDGPRIAAPRVSVDPEGTEPITRGYGSVEGPPVVHPYVAMVDPVGKAARFEGMAEASSRRGRCLLPRGAVGLGAQLFVTCLGQSTLLELDGRALDPMAAPRRIVPLPAGPAGIAADGDVAVVHAEHDRALAFVALDDGSATALELPRRTEPDPRFARGRQLFHTTDDSRISRDGRACASCHPDGRADGLTWSTPDGPRQTIMLAGRLPQRTAARFGWMGRHRSLEEHVGQTMGRLLGHGLSADDRDALIHYLRTMEAPDRPVEQTEAWARGQALFVDEQTGCASCHPGGTTDDRRHDVGSGNPIEASLKFDTPSLRFVGATAPYFHDGRYATLAEVLSADDRMGHSRNLSAADRAALETYLRSL